MRHGAHLVSVLAFYVFRIDQHLIVGMRNGVSKLLTAVTNNKKYIERGGG